MLASTTHPFIQSEKAQLAAKVWQDIATTTIIKQIQKLTFLVAFRFIFFLFFAGVGCCCKCGKFIHFLGILLLCKNSLFLDVSTHMHPYIRTLVFIYT